MMAQISPPFRGAMSSLVLLAVFASSILAAAPNPNPCTEFGIGNGPQITKGIPQPGWSTAQLDAWWTKMKVWRANLKP